MANPLLSCVAEDVGGGTIEYSPDNIVYWIAFGAEGREADGHCWTFSRSFDDDWGVCTVREIQRATIYGGIEKFQLRRSGVECVFDQKAAEKTGFNELRIAFAIDDKSWQELAATAKIVFRDCLYFTLAE